MKRTVKQLLGDIKSREGQIAGIRSEIIRDKKKLEQAIAEQMGCESVPCDLDDDIVVYCEGYMITVKATGDGRPDHYSRPAVEIVPVETVQ